MPPTSMVRIHTYRKGKPIDSDDSPLDESDDVNACDLDDGERSEPSEKASDHTETRTIQTE